MIGETRPRAVEEAEMVDTLSQLHQDVQQADLVGRAPPFHYIEVLHWDFGVDSLCILLSPTRFLVSVMFFSLDPHGCDH